MKRNILITAYAVNPYKGSEDGTGWNIICQIAQTHQVTAITRRNNEPHINRYRQLNTTEYPASLQFEYFDLPTWLRFWKKGGRGALLYHYLWHLAVVFFIRKRNFTFDIAHHLNFHSSWSPSFLWLLGKPLVWGPVGHHPRIPKGYLRHYAPTQRWLDALKWRAKQLAWIIDPFLAVTRRKAKAVLGVNSQINCVLRAPAHRFFVVPAIAAEPPQHHAPPPPPHPYTFHIISIGRFVPLKGFDIALEAFAYFYHQLMASQREGVHFSLIGQGPEKARLQALALRLGLPHSSLSWVDWAPKAELPAYFEQADLFFFPSHEGAGMVIPEAMSYGIPCLCFDNAGPGESMGPHAGLRVPYSTYQQSILDFSEAILQLYQQPKLRSQLGHQASIRYQQHFKWSSKAQQIDRIYDRILASTQ
jgi:glycosyltransferase involved in cell wall biosynthesis